MLRSAEEEERALRHSVGPTAWAVLADLCLDARPDDGGVLVVAASARRVAADIGVGKDTAARALRRLMVAGVLSRRAQPTDEAGRFGRCLYELHFDPRPLPLPRPRKADTVAPRVRKARTRGATPGQGDQLSLLELTTAANGVATEAHS